MYQKLAKELESEKVALVVVSKTRSDQEILDIYNQGHRVFGENRVQELVDKFSSLPKDIRWHLIGSLQKNKVKYIAPFVDLIHSVDSYELAIKIEKEALKNDRVISILIQLKISHEPSKQGLDPLNQSEELEKILTYKWKNIQIVGLMGMASFVESENQIRKEFKSLHSLFSKLKRTYFLDNPSFHVLSMGMSGDYKIAISEGSNMVRIGSLLFGPRV